MLSYADAVKDLITPDHYTQEHTRRYNSDQYYSLDYENTHQGITKYASASYSETLNHRHNDDNLWAK